jgi:hypothetical protein
MIGAPSLNTRTWNQADRSEGSPTQPQASPVLLATQDLVFVDHPPAGRRFGGSFGGSFRGSTARRIIVFRVLAVYIRCSELCQLLHTYTQFTTHRQADASCMLPLSKSSIMQRETHNAHTCIPNRGVRKGACARLYGCMRGRGQRRGPRQITHAMPCHKHSHLWQTILCGSGNGLPHESDLGAMMPI